MRIVVAVQYVDSNISIRHLLLCNSEILLRGVSFSLKNMPLYVVSIGGRSHAMQSDETALS